MSRKQKKEKFTKKEGREIRIRKVHLAGLALAVAVAFLLFGGTGAERAKGIANEVREGQSAEDPDSLYVPVSKINDGKAHFYTYPSKTGKTIRFFVLKSSDGIFRAAFDACDVCYREGKGYRQEGDMMVCNNCGRKFPSVRINVEQGGCNPAPLERRIEGEYLVIKKSDIESGARYF